MGTVSIAMPAAQWVAQMTNSNLAATMTFIYGVGQIAGLIVANAFYAQSHSFSLSLVTAAVALILAGLSSLSNL